MAKNIPNEEPGYENQVDITELTLFGDCRENQIYKTKVQFNGGMGHVFWSDAERRLFQYRFYNSNIKKGKKISMDTARGFARQLSDEFPDFSMSFSDSKIVTSLYYCVNNMCGKRKFLKPGSSVEEIYKWSMSDMAVVQRNYTNIRERTRLYYGKK
jgi:hypothetical protein